MRTSNKAEQAKRDWWRSLYLAAFGACVAESFREDAPGGFDWAAEMAATYASAAMLESWKPEGGAE